MLFIVYVKVVDLIEDDRNIDTFENFLNGTCQFRPNSNSGYTRDTFDLALARSLKENVFWPAESSS